MDRGTVFVVGAGPAGLFAAKKLASAGYDVITFNRDIKPGGLAEYGIYPQKFHMKGGLRKQFFKFLEMPNLNYFGNTPIAEQGALTVGELRQWNPTAIVFAVGAQGTKTLGLPGESGKGLYSAKDYVYHYNQLPPFAAMDFSIGRRVAIVGMGNVMVDIARWLLVDMPGKHPDEVVVIARRGPFEAKFDEREFDYIEAHLDRASFQEELRRVDDRLRAAGQDVGKVTTFPWVNLPPGATVPGKLSFRFLTSPAAVLLDDHRRINRLRVAENLLIRNGASTAARATGETVELEFDTLIYAIGDIVDPALGLPHDSKGLYVTNPDGASPGRAAYEVFDPTSGRVIQGEFVVGWARKASEGVVGKARFDAEQGCDHILKFLESAPKKTTAPLEEIVREFARRGVRAVDKSEIKLLARAEEAEARVRNLPAIKFPTNDQMLAAIEKEKSSAGPAKSGSEAA